MTKNGIIRSPLFYVGDKYKLIEEIRQKFPTDINRFIEPFVGGGSVFLNVPARTYLLNDIDTNVINLHKLLCKYVGKEELFFKNLYSVIEEYGLSCSYKEDVIPAEMKAKFVKTYFARYNKEAYTRLRDDFNNASKKDYIKLYLLLIYGFNHMLRFNSAGNFNLPVGNVDFNNNVVTALQDYFSAVAKKEIVWSSLDYKKFLAKANLNGDDFIYLDPPYLITFSEYNKLWNEQTENELLETLSELDQQGIKFAISNVTHYKGRVNRIFLNWAKNYHSHPIKSNYISFRDNAVKKFSEVLVTNY